MIAFTHTKIKKLSNVCLDIGKGSVLAGFAVPLFHDNMFSIGVIESLLLGGLLIYLGLQVAPEEKL